LKLAMADFEASVAALLSLAITVVEISHRYFSNAKNATTTVKGYFREIEALRLLLYDFKTLDYYSVSSATRIAVEGCHSELERLRSRLQKRTTENALSNAIHRLTWPFAEEETRRLIDVIHRYLDVFHAALSLNNVRLSTTTLEAVRNVESRLVDDERQKILSWLSPVNPYTNHTSARDKHEATTGLWFLNSSDFHTWEQGNHCSLLLTGIPGAGKTVLCSTIIDFLQKRRKVDEAVLVFYFDFSDDQKQSVNALLRSLLAQSCSLLDAVPSEIIHLFETSRRSSKRPTFDRHTLSDLLKTVLTSFDSVTIILDALDESSEVSGVLGLLHDFSKEFDNVRWLVASRQQQEIEESLSIIASSTVSLDNAGVDADIRRSRSEAFFQANKDQTTD
jgi:ankyrin repeat domain-containing protein 50